MLRSSWVQGWPRRTTPFEDLGCPAFRQPVTCESIQSNPIMPIHANKREMYPCEIHVHFVKGKQIIAATQCWKILHTVSKCQIFFSKNVFVVEKVKGAACSHLTHTTERGGMAVSIFLFLFRTQGQTCVLSVGVLTKLQRLLQRKIPGSEPKPWSLCTWAKKLLFR